MSSSTATSHATLLRLARARQEDARPARWMLTTRARRRSPSRCRAPHILTLALAASTLGVISFALHWRRALASQLPVVPPPPPPSPPPPSPSPSTSLTPRRQPPHVDTPGAYVLVSFKNGAVLGDGLRLLVSRDARRWHALPNEPLVLPLAETGGKVFRDPSILWWHGAFHLVWSSDLCVGQMPGKWKCKGAPTAEADRATATPGHCRAKLTARGAQWRRPQGQEATGRALRLRELDRSRQLARRASRRGQAARCMRACSLTKLAALAAAGLATYGSRRPPVWARRASTGS